MAKMIRCACCGGMVSSDCTRCVHCGAKIPKSKTGCLIFLVLVLVVIAATTALPKHDFNDMPPSTPKVHVYKEDVAHSFAVTYLQKKFSTPVRTNGKYTVKKLPPAAAMKGVVKGDTYAFEQDFIETNQFNVEIKHRYRAVVEFYAPRGYRVIWFMVDGVKI